MFYPYTGAVFQATTDSYKRLVSGVVFGYDDNKVRLWVPIDDPRKNGNGKYIFSLNKQILFIISNLKTEASVCACVWEERGGVLCGNVDEYRKIKYLRSGVSKQNTLNAVLYTVNNIELHFKRTIYIFAMNVIF